jgi:HK97 family phage major capsid protein
MDYGFLTRAAMAGTLRTAKSSELSIIAKCEEQHGKPNGDPDLTFRIPTAELRGVFKATSGGNLVATNHGTYIETLRQRPTVVRLVNVEPADRGDVVWPRGTGGTTATWQQLETTDAPPSNMTFGQISSTPKMLNVLTTYSRVLGLQSNFNQIFRAEAADATTVELERTVLNGSGIAGQPLGILGTPGIGSITGASLGYAGLVGAQTTVANGVAVQDPARCAYAAPPDVASLLKQRYRVATTDTPVWQGPLVEGAIEGVLAFGTKNVPAATLLFGDFSAVTIVEYPTAEIAIDPFTDFQSGRISIRLSIPVDIIVRYPTAFTAAIGSVT